MQRGVGIARTQNEFFQWGYNWVVLNWYTWVNVLHLTYIVASPKNENLPGGRPFLWYEGRNPFGIFLASIWNKPVLEVIDHKNRALHRETQERRLNNGKKIFTRFSWVFRAYFYHMVFRLSGKLSRGGSSPHHFMGRRGWAPQSDFLQVTLTLIESLVREKPLYPPSQKTTGVSPWMNAMADPPTFVGHSRLRSAKAEARRAKEGASADSAEERKDTTGVNPWRLHLPELGSRFVSWEQLR